MPSLRKFRTLVRQYRHYLTAMDGGNADIAGAIYLPSSTSASFDAASDPVQASDDNTPKYRNYRYDCTHSLCNAHQLRELHFADAEAIYPPVAADVV